MDKQKKGCVKLIKKTPRFLSRRFFVLAIIFFDDFFDFLFQFFRQFRIVFD